MTPDIHERAMPLRLTGWEFDTIVLALEGAIDGAEDRQYEHDVRSLVLELARQLNEYLEST